MGALVVALDLCSVVVLKKSLFGLKHGWSTLALLPAWAVASAVTGYFGCIAGVLQPTLFGSLAAGIAWNSIAVGLVKKFAETKQERTETDFA